MGRDPVSPPKKLSEVLSHSDGPNLLPGTLFQMKTLTIPFVSTVMEIVKTPLLLTCQLIWIMHPMKHLTLVGNPQQTCFLLLTFTITPILKPRNSYWYHTKPDEQPPAGLVDQHVSHLYHLELILLNDANKKQKTTHH